MKRLKKVMQAFDTLMEVYGICEDRLPETGDPQLSDCPACMLGKLKEEYLKCTVKNTQS
jgi:hypothetical protein